MAGPLPASGLCEGENDPEQPVFLLRGDSVTVDFRRKDDLAAESSAFDFHGEDLTALARGVASRERWFPVAGNANPIRENIDVDMLLFHPGEVHPDFEAVVVAIGIDFRGPALGGLESGKMQAVEIGRDLAGATNHAGETNLARHEGQDRGILQELQSRGGALK